MHVSSGGTAVWSPQRAEYPEHHSGVGDLEKTNWTRKQGQENILPNNKICVICQVHKLLQSIIAGIQCAEVVSSVLFM